MSEIRKLAGSDLGKTQPNIINLLAHTLLDDEEVKDYMKNRRNKRARYNTKVKTHNIIDKLGLDFYYDDWDFKIVLDKNDSRIMSLEDSLKDLDLKIIKTNQNENKVMIHLIL